MILDVGVFAVVCLALTVQEKAVLPVECTFLRHDLYAERGIVQAHLSIRIDINRRMKNPGDADIIPSTAPNTGDFLPIQHTGNTFEAGVFLGVLLKNAVDDLQLLLVRD